jgi:hypothetical protein
MPQMLDGSCRCRSVHFSMMSHTPYPHQLCCCSISRKTAGGGGFAINLMGDYRTPKVRGRRAIRILHAKIEEKDGYCEKSKGQRHFSSKCATALWLHDPEWPEIVHAVASAIDTKLPKPSKVDPMLRFKAPWVELDFGPGDARFQKYPKLSIEDRHLHRGLWID